MMVMLYWWWLRPSLWRCHPSPPSRPLPFERRDFPSSRSTSPLCSRRWRPWWSWLKVINIDGVACWCSRPRWDRKYKSRTLLNQFHHLDYPSFLSFPSFDDIQRKQDIYLPLRNTLNPNTHSSTLMSSAKSDGWECAGKPWWWWWWWWQSCKMSRIWRKYQYRKIGLLG